MKKLNDILSLLNNQNIEECQSCSHCCSNRGGNCPASYDNDMTDYYNINQSRNFSNIHIAKYNCGGFALNTYNWFLPDYHVINLGEYRDITVRAAWSMVDKFQGDLRIINNLNEVYNDEYSIMFRFEMSDRSVDIAEKLCDGCPNIHLGCGDCNGLDESDLNWYLGDFHFIREFNGHWVDKPGSDKIKQMSENNIFNIWNSRYKGEIVIMAMKKKRDILLSL